MKEFDYIIIGGGCAGLSLAYELEIFDKLKTKKLAIIEPRTRYQRDKTWSFWKVIPHNFEDCVKSNWKNFSLNFPSEVKHLKCESYPYQTIDSNLFYKKVLNKLALNKNESSTCYELGDNSTTLFRHYRKLVTLEQSLEFFRIRPFNN